MKQFFIGVGCTLFIVVIVVLISDFVVKPNKDELTSTVASMLETTTTAEETTVIATAEIEATTVTEISIVEETTETALSDRAEALESFKTRLRNELKAAGMVTWDDADFSSRLDTTFDSYYGDDCWMHDYFSQDDITVRASTECPGDYEVGMYGCENLGWYKDFCVIFYVTAEGHTDDSEEEIELCSSLGMYK